jgi:pimeloyl-ACP methyl ester carboxylesterase
VLGRGDLNRFTAAPLSRMASIRVHMRESERAGFPGLECDGRADRPYLLLCHGSFSTHVPFARWLDLFAQHGWRAGAFSRRGRLGREPSGTAGVHIADYLDDTRRVVDALGEQPVIIGHSLGGLIAQKLAEEGRAAAAVLLAPVPPWPLVPQNEAVPAVMPHVPAIVAGQPFRPTYWSAVRLILNRVPQPDRRRIYDSLVHESGIVYREMTLGTVRVAPDKVRCPVCVIAASEDRVISPKLAASIADYYDAQITMQNTMVIG